MASPWLSVIVPSHNGERWLGAALQSLVDQQLPGIEIILIDASATDESLRIAENYSDRLNIRAERRPDLLPWTEKTNYGVELATGAWICILHQDDLWLPNRSAKLRDWLSRQTDAVMHLHPCYIIDEAGRRLGLWRCPLTDNGSPVPVQLLLERLLVQNFVAIPTPVIRRDAYLRTGGLDLSLWYTADWDLYLKIAAARDVYYHSIPLACFRVHKSSLTVRGSKNEADFRRQHQLVVDRHAERLAAQSRQKVLPIASASIEVNTALAAAIGGEFTQIFKAMAAILALGPRGMQQYLLCSRILDRALPRLRARVRGRF
jgi:glycosyltransferase involved in cell wall biosynthesis